ncbi:DNA repair protein RadA [Methylococcus mesophilus]|uniref:DNA repair protein RadA n=1 Tax=Methylococcus mesophilus TaxID=2993564 RepID=UPI00224A9A16|nr:DNA repair protein RadA [Methylococcus mesophilus]UZR31065.1 DNA repair protein RadA [Methylococcus mesophilus]
MRSKPGRVVYRCTECGQAQPKWGGQCGGCGLWNTLVEEVEAPAPSRRQVGYAGVAEASVPVSLAEVSLEELARVGSGLAELDRVLGGGVVPGSAILLGGDPGIGKSTLLLQTLAFLGKSARTLYVTGEESLSQVSLRAHRLGLDGHDIQALAETSLERILGTASQYKPEVLVVDSIQTVYSEALQSAPGSVGQVRECAAQLVRYAKQSSTTVFLVGHVTKEGALAGPRVLEHMVDTVLYFEGDASSRYRVVRSFKNRFGAVNELGVFAMTETGLKEVRNPSAIFLSRGDEDMPGSIVTVTREGSRPLLVEVQALVDESHLQAPRRLVVGMEMNRLAMLLAVLHRHGGVPVAAQDVFVNLVGGVRLTETAGDLAVACAVVSSFRDRPVPGDWVIFGELGLNGEIRPVPNGDERLREAAKHGFKHALVPAKNAPKQGVPGVSIIPAKNLREAINAL